MRTGPHRGSQMGAPGLRLTSGSKPFGKNSLLVSPPPLSAPKNALPELRGSAAGAPITVRPPARVGAKLRLSGPRPPVCGYASRRPAPTSHGSLRGVLSLGVKPNTFFPHLRDAGPTGARTPDGHTAAGGPLSRPSLPAPRAVPAVGTQPPLYLRPSGCTARAAG